MFEIEITGFFSKCYKYTFCKACCWFCYFFSTNIYCKSWTEIKHNKERNIELVSQVYNLSFVLSPEIPHPSKIAGRIYRTFTSDGI